MLTDQQKADVKKLVTAASGNHPVPEATDRPGSPAEILCPECGAPFSVRVIAVEAKTYRLLCETCREERQRTGTITKPLHLFQLPGLYVAALVTFALVLWWSGWGNNNVEKTRARDAERLWFKKRYPLSLIIQSDRARKRGDYLMRTGKDGDARRWYQLAQTSALEAAEEWKGTAAEPLVRFNAARLCAKRGDFKQAYAEFQQLAGRLDFGETATAFHYERGMAALSAGFLRDGQRGLDGVLTSLNQSTDRMAGFNRYVDAAIERAEKGANPEKALMRNLREKAGLFTDRHGMINGILKAYRTHGISSDLSKELALQYRDDEDAVPPDTHGKVKQLKFEEFDE